ncbi:MAG: hypothetical protein K2Y23_12910 [Cyanobacteria bacterium]|nr:hypothetical protein [Cyanobacteriota bacterium]
MNRAALEHIVRASAAVSNEREIVIIGSHAVLGQYPDAPPALLISMDADVYPRHAPDKSAVIDGAIGELSAFHEAFGYYAHGIGDTTATLPAGWADRLVPIQNENTGGAIGWCLDVHDLALSKLVAGRDKDLDFVQTLLQEDMAAPRVLTERVKTLPVSGAQLEAVIARLHRLSTASGRP